VPGANLTSLLPLLPSVVRGPDGRLRIRGGQPVQSTLQVSGANVTDPSTGDFALELPIDAIDAIEVINSPYQAEYGRFSSSITRIRTRPGGERWRVVPNSFIPRPLSKPGSFMSFRGIRSFQPRVIVSGPIKSERLYLAQSAQYQLVRTPVKSIEGQPTVDLEAIDTFTRVYAVISTRHTLIGGLAFFPREIEHVNLGTFTPIEVTPTYRQGGYNFGFQDNLVLSATAVLETLVSYRRYDVDIRREGTDPMRFSPGGQSGSFFNEQDRRTRSLQYVQSLTFSRKGFRGDHLFKVGVDVLAATFTGASRSARVEIHGLDGSLLERLTYGPESAQDESGTDVAVFLQDRWRPLERVAVDIGMRFEGDGTIGHFNQSPRAGITWDVKGDGRSVIRAGLGTFWQRTPLTVPAFEKYEMPTVERFSAGGARIDRIAYRPAVAEELETPRAVVASFDVTHRFGSFWLAKAALLNRRGSEEFVLEPRQDRGVVELLNDGRSRYWEVELTARYFPDPRRDFAVSYVRSKARADLNAYDTFFGNFRAPILRPNEWGPTPTDTPHRVIARGILGLPWKLDLLPVIEVRSGFPWSAVDERQDFVGPRNRTGRLPRVSTVDLSLSRPVRILKYRPRLGIRVYNAFGSNAAREVQNNVASPDFGRFYNPIDRGVGLVFSFGG
jgi:hypothetical protein